MERHTGKRAPAGTIAPKKGCSLGCKSTTTDKDQNLPFCNRIGCSGRIKYSQNQNTKMRSSEKVKPPKPSLSTSNVNELPGNSSRAKMPLPSQSVSSPSTEKNCRSGGSKSQELILPSSSRTLSRHRLGLNSSLPSNITPRKTFHPKPETSNSKTSSLRTQNNNKSSNSGSSSSRSSSSSISTSTSSTYGLRNLKSNSISNNVPPSSSSPESKSAGKSIVKKKLPESGRQKTCVPGISITGSGRSNAASGDGNITAGSVRTRRPTNTTRLNVGGRPHSSEPELRINVGRAQLFSNGTSSSFIPLSSNPAGELDFTSLMNHESLNMSGLAEVLSTLERIRQEEGWTTEQVLDLDNNLFTHGLNLSDQHRDMRLDIDNMSYEELLALEEKMGSVSTALSDEALLKCIKRSIYDVGPPEVKVTGSGEEGGEIKCSICQEDFALGDETGELVGCQHEYHLMCINQWLQLKNWCPICKASVAAPQEASPSE